MKGLPIRNLAAPLAVTLLSVAAAVVSVALYGINSSWPAIINGLIGTGREWLPSPLAAAMKEQTAELQAQTEAFKQLLQILHSQYDGPPVTSRKPPRVPQR